MSRWPRTLFGRNAALLVLLLLLGQGIGVVLLQRLLYLPRVEHAAHLVARQMQALRQGLQALPADQRDAFVQRYNQGTGPDRATAQAPVAVERLALLDQAFIRALTEQLVQQGIDVVGGDEGLHGLWFRFALDGVVHAVWVPDVVPGRAFSGALIAMLAGSTLIALAGALWLQRRLNRPLERVVRAAQDLASDRVPPALPEDGPLEIATVGRSFNRMVASLTHAERERTLMLAGISHDLRTPLTKLRLGIEILLGHSTETELLAGMTRSVDDMDGIVGQFMDFARPDTDTPAIRLSFDDLVRETLPEGADAQRPVQLRLGAPTPWPMQPLAMRRVLSNLIENAWRHGHPPVEVHTWAQGRETGFEVRDHGPGVPPADRTRLLQAFVRGEAARGGVSGAGLGLAIADRIVRRHGGRLELLNAHDGGLRVRAVFALEPGVPTAAEPQRPRSPDR